MPKILELQHGLSVYIYFKDHNPPHVHVYWEILEVNGFSQKDVKKAISELRKQETVLMEKWNEYKE